MKTPREILHEYNITYIETKKGTYTTTCPNCNGGYLNVKIDRKGACWHCHDCKWSGPQPREKEEGGGDLGPIKAVFDYTDETGERLFQALKFEPLNAPKQFRQRLGPDQDKWSIKGVRIVPYRLPELIADIAAERVVFVVEGEKDVDTLRDHGVPATSGPMGAGKWWPEFNTIMLGADVVICGDNDEPGRNHVRLVARNLHGIAARVRVLDLATVWPDIEESDDVTAWFEGGGSVERLWEIVESLSDWQPESGGNGEAPWEREALPDDLSEAYEPLPYVDLALDPIPPREWLVPERIPMGNVTMLGGDGSIGKSILLMQLSGAVVIGKDWIGTLPEPGAVLYMSCEEDNLECCRRMENVARHFGSTRQEMIDHGLRVLSFAGKDAVLAQPDRNGIMRPTPLFERLRRDALELRPKLIVLDNLVDVYAGKEMDRAQTRQFITLLRGLAIDTGAAVVMSAHPSLTGISTDTGLSGNTGWHNSVRARMYFKPAPGEDTALRVLEVKKNNYGPVNEAILLRWRDGVYVVEPGKGTLERQAAEAEIDHLFLKLLRRFTEQGRNVSDNVSPTYAPSVFTNEPEAKKAKTKKRDFVDAMARLFAAGRIRVEPFGTASRMRSKIVEAEGFQRPSNALPTTSNVLPTRGATQTCVGETSETSAFLFSNAPLNGLPTPSNGCAHTPPIPPIPVGNGQGAFEDAARSNGREGEDEQKNTPDDEPEMWS